MQPAGGTNTPPGGALPQLRHRPASSSNSPPGPGDGPRRSSRDEWGDVALPGRLDTFERQASSIERGGLPPPALPTHVDHADAVEPPAQAAPLGQRAWAWARWGGRNVMKVLPLIPIYAATLTTVALIFALKNFNILDQSRAATLVRLLRVEVGTAHTQILSSLAAFHDEFNATLREILDDFQQRL